MHKNGKMITLAVAAVAVIAGMFVTSNVYASTNAATAKAAARTLDSNAMRKMMVPASLQPASSSFFDAITIKEAVATHQFEAGPGLTSNPVGCLQMTDAIGDLKSLDGWMQSGERAASVAPNSLQRYFTTAVFKIPGGASASVDKVAALLKGCTAGTISFGKVNGTISYKEHAAPALGSARTFATTLTTTLPQETASGNLEEVACEAELSVVASGELLIWVVEPTKALATSSTNAVYARALAGS